MNNYRVDSKSNARDTGGTGNHKGLPLHRDIEVPAGNAGKTGNHKGLPLHRGIEVLASNAGLPLRKSMRLKEYDYSQAGLYFITICAQNQLCLFGEIENEEMKTNDAGMMIERQWQELPRRFDNINLREFVVMPNHFHGILEFVEVPLVGTQNVEHSPEIGQPQGIAPTVGDVVGTFKSLSTNDYIQGVKNKNWKRFNKKLWQRNFYDHIIRC